MTPSKAFRAKPSPTVSAAVVQDALAELLATGLLTTRPNPYHDAGWAHVGLSAGPAYNFSIRDMRVGGRFARMDDLIAERRAEKLLADVLAEVGPDALADAVAWEGGE
jgi:hypothetical protein